MDRHVKHGMAQANPDWLSFVQGFPAMIFWQQGQDESILNLTAYGQRTCPALAPNIQNVQNCGFWWGPFKPTFVIETCYRERETLFIYRIIDFSLLPDSRRRRLWSEFRHRLVGPHCVSLAFFFTGSTVVQASRLGGWLVNIQMCQGRPFDNLLTRSCLHVSSVSSTHLESLGYTWLHRFNFAFIMLINFIALIILYYIYIYKY